MIICPSCGSGVRADLCLGCPSCGARAVGPPLARAEHELPSFGRAALAFYRKIGLELPDGAESEDHVEAQLPGGYRFGDYWHLGLPLSSIVVVVGVPLIL